MSLSMSLPSISIPSKKDLWLNLESTKSVLSWYKNIYERRKKIKANAKKLKDSFYKLKNSKKNQNIFNMIIDQDADYEAKEWKKTFFDFCEKNTHENDNICIKDDIFSFLE
jgi:hypothetical protein